MSNSKPKRLEQNHRSKAPLIICAVFLSLIALAAGGYLGLCGWVQSNDLLLPGTVVSGLPDGKSADLSKMDADSATRLIDSYLAADLEQRNLTVSYGEGQTVTLEGDLLTTDASLPVTEALAWKRSQPFYLLGLMWFGMSSEGSGEQTVSPLALSAESETMISQTAARIAEELYIAPVDFSYEVTDETVELTLGSDGQAVDQEALTQTMKDALLSGETSLTVSAEPVASAELTGEILNDLVQAPAQVSSIGADGALTPTTIGWGVDADEAQALIDQTEAGQSCSIPLVYIMPDLSGAEDILFQDVLASSDTYMAGPEGRRNNIRLAAAAIDGTVVFPGQTFSYNAVVGERTAEKGYREATVYVQGEDRQELGGGICQLASALYYCSLYSNLEIVERKPHRFAVTYVPYGLDATIAWGSIDYKFTNNTDYPIRVSAVTEGNYLYVKLYGTKADDTYVKMENIQLSRTPYSTLYKVDPGTAAGQTTELVHAYTGYKYEVYRCVYSGDGTLLSRTFENTSTYSYRNKVIGVNAADAAQYGIDPTLTTPQAEGSYTAPVVSPEPSPEPSTEPSPSPDPEPSEDPAPDETLDPEPSEELDDTIRDWIFGDDPTDPEG